MWTFQLDLVAAFCVSAVIMFLVSLALMMLIVFIRRPKPEPMQSQGPASDIVYVPTTVQNTHAGPHCPDVVKPLLNNIGNKVTDNSTVGIYPTKELEPLREELREV